MTDRDFLNPIERSDCDDYIEARVLKAPKDISGSLRTTLRFLYLSQGPINLPRKRLKAAEPFLEPAERILARWLYTRTNGSERKNYGGLALEAARRQRYRCEHCGHADVRVLQLDHVEGQKHQGEFACLCANCHMLKSREQDWSGHRSPK